MILDPHKIQQIIDKLENDISLLIETELTQKYQDETTTV